MTATPYIPSTSGKFQKVVAQLQDSGGNDHDSGNPLPITITNLSALDDRYVEVAGDTMTGFLTLSADPTNALHAATKQYVDLAVTSLGARYYLLDSDDATGYKETQLSAPTGGEASYSANDLTDDEYIMGWISPVGGGPAKLLEGVYDLQITAEKTGGTKTLRLYWELVERKSDDSEVVVATSSFTDEITDKGVFHPIIVLSSDHELESDSRVVGKVYASVTGSGNAPSVTLYYEGNLDSHWEIPANDEIFSNIYVDVAGDTMTGALESPSFTVGGRDILRYCFMMGR